MSKKIARKKFDFFNGGKGVNLSDYCAKLSLENSSLNSEATPEDLTSYQSYEKPSSPLTSSGYSSNQLPALDSPPPRDSPLDNSSRSPPPLTCSYNNFHDYHEQARDFNSFSDGPQYNQQRSSMVLEAAGQSQFSSHLPSPLSSYGATSLPAPYQVMPSIPDSCYGGYMAHGPYASLQRTMNEMPPLEGPYDTSVPLFENSESGSNGVEASRRKKRQQKCSLCSNHGLTVDVKGHKWFCQFRNCPCERCEITKGRQHHMKEQQKLTRSLQRLQ